MGTLQSGVTNGGANDLARQCNEGQKDDQIVPVFKGTYDESMTAAIAAFRAGNVPGILQVFEVGIRKHNYATKQEARSYVFSYIEMFYNPIRRHSSADGLSPVEYERRNSVRLATI